MTIVNFPVAITTFPLGSMRGNFRTRRKKNLPEQLTVSDGKNNHDALSFRPKGGIYIISLTLFGMTGIRFVEPAARIFFFLTVL